MGMTCSVLEPEIVHSPHQIGFEEGKKGISCKQFCFDGNSQKEYMEGHKKGYMIFMREFTKKLNLLAKEND